MLKINQMVARQDKEEKGWVPKTNIHLHVFPAIKPEKTSHLQEHHLIPEESKRDHQFIKTSI